MLKLYLRDSDPFRALETLTYHGGGSSESTTTATPGPGVQISDLDVGRDIEAENAVFSTFQRAQTEFLSSTEPERGALQAMIDKLSGSFGNIEAALGGEVPTSQLPIAKQALSSNLRQESNAVRNIENQLAAANAGSSFFGQRLQSQAKSDFGRERAQIVPDLIRTILQDQAPIAQMAGQGQLDLLALRAGITRDAGSFAANFNAPSRVKTQNLAEVARQSQSGTSTTTTGK